MSYRCGLLLLCPLTLLCTCGRAPEPPAETTEAPPNIVIFYIDDLGYGDLGSYGATGVATPNVDRLAAAGTRFTDAHCGAATCTPSRYSLLTGEYAFRRNAAVLEGSDPLLIDTNQLTLPGMLRQAGYATGVVGKWHLGLGDGTLDWNEKIAPGPLEVGFDYCYLIPATGDRVPTVYVENHRILGLDPADPLRISYGKKIGDEPTGRENPELLRYAADNQHASSIVNGVSRIGFQTGGKSAYWTDEDFPDTLGRRAKAFVREHREEPFFLFYSFHDIHVPRLPHPRFRGKSEQGWRGDAIVQMDWMVGDLLQELDRLGLTENTLVIFTSDNGPALKEGYADQAAELIGDHRPAGPYRGGKYSAYEAGTRVPTIVRWPDEVAAGRTSAALLTQLDLFASLAELVDVNLPKGTAVDSEEQLFAWLGRDTTGQDIIVEESYTLSLRQGNWKYIRPRDPGTRFDWIKYDKEIESGLSAEAQLFNLSEDPGEQRDLLEEQAEIAAEMEATLRQIEERK
ncbi:MAG: arylsulfatase [Bacteroidota bacterium]